jgi:hypothetical protein
MMLGECRPMSARITPRQCAINQERDLYSCGKCVGLVNVRNESFKEVNMPKKEEGAGRRGKHLLCKVPGCDNIRVKNQMCMKHYKECLQQPSGEIAPPPAAPAPFTPCDISSTYGATAPDSAEDISVAVPSILPEQTNSPGPLSALLPPPIPAEHRPGFFLDLTAHPELHAWLRDLVKEADIPMAVIGLLEARRNDLLRLSKV